jgi:hypothetical protein
MNQLQGKQFRGLRTRSGKLIRNKVGGYERSRGDDSYDQRRRDLLQRALIAEERESTDEVFEHLQQNATCDCAITGQVVAANGIVLEDTDDFNTVLVVKYDNGRMVSAHLMDYFDAVELQQD